MEPPWVGGTKVCSRHLGHMTKMTAAPIYGKNPSTIFSRTGGPIFTKLGMKHRGLQPIIGCSNDDPGVTLTYFTAISNLETLAFVLEKVKTVDFIQTIEACDLKVGRYRELIDFMKECEYRRSRSFLDLGPRSCTYKNSNQMFSETTVPVWTKFCMKYFRYKENENLLT